MAKVETLRVFQTSFCSFTSSASIVCILLWIVFQLPQLHNSDYSRVCPALSCKCFQNSPKKHGQACLNSTNFFSSLLFVAVINTLA